MEEMEKQNVTPEENAVEAADLLRVVFKVTEDEVVNALDRMDKLQGSNKRQQIIFAVIMAIAAIDAYQFISTKSGFALILTMVFLVLGVFYKKKSNFGNRRLGEAFAADPEQVVAVRENELKLSERVTAYDDVKVMYQFKNSFGINYMGNHYFVIPKRVFEGEELEQFVKIMEEKLGERYQDRSDMR